MDKEFEPEIEQESEEFLDGFNVKTIIAAIFIGFVMLPGSIYLALVTGGVLGHGSMWVTMILFVEIAKRAFVKLKRQEIYIIGYVAAGLVTFGAQLGAASLVLQGGIFGDKIWQQFLVQSSQAKAFGLSKLLPSWVVPSATSDAIVKRIFIHREWLIPFLILIGHHILFRLNWFGLSYALFRRTSDVEKLEFPMARVMAEGSKTLEDISAKKDTWRMQVFTIAGMIGIIYGLIYITIPTLTGLIAAKPLMLIPIPWVDATTKIGTFLPGAMLGIWTDMGYLFMGFFLPFWVVIGGFIGSILSKFIGNPILYKLGLIPNWKHGMDVRQTHVSTNIDFWLSIALGLVIAVAIIGLFLFFKSLTKAGMEAKKKESLSIEYRKKRGDIPIFVALSIWVFSTLAYIVLCHILVPKFPLVLLFMFGFILTPLLSYVSARMFGIAGLPGGISFPMVREGTFILSGYKGVAIWFAPVPFFNHGFYVQKFKELELTRTKLKSLIKAEIASFFIFGFCSFLFWQIIWKMGPIPAPAYAFANKWWPLTATFQTLWATSTLEGGSKWMLGAIKPSLIMGGGVVGLITYGITVLSGIPVGLFYGIVAGVSVWWPHHIIPMFIGALLGRFYFAKKFGQKNWKSYTPLLLVGYSCGMGLIAMVSMAIALIFKSVSQIIF